MFLWAGAADRALCTAAKHRCPLPLPVLPTRHCSLSQGKPRPPVPRCRHCAVGLLRQLRALGQLQSPWQTSPLSLFNEAPCLIRAGRPAFIKRELWREEGLGTVLTWGYWTCGQTCIARVSRGKLVATVNFGAGWPGLGARAGAQQEEG